jgi:hypothetical protein
VKPFFLFNLQNFGSRFYMFKQIVHLIVGLIPNIKDVMSSFSFGLTMFTEKHFDELPYAIDNILSNLNETEKQDINFRYFLTQFKNELIDKRVLNIDPFGNKDEYLEIVFQNKNSIKNPNEVFKPAFSSQTTTNLKDYLSNTKDLVDKYSKNFNFDVAMEKLNELQAFYNETDIQIIKETYNGYKNKINYFKCYVSNEIPMFFNFHEYNLKFYFY